MNTDALTERLRTGDADAAAALFAHYRERLRHMVALRLDRRLQGRLDPSDVLQEAFLDVQRKLAEYPEREMPAYLWLRLITSERLLILHRQHLDVQARDAGREVTLPSATAHSLAEMLLARHVSPSEAALRAEQQQRLLDALATLEPLDREVLALRHFEELSNAEVASVLGLSKTAASNRYIRALKRLKEILAEFHLDGAG